MAEETPRVVRTSDNLCSRILNYMRWILWWVSRSRNLEKITLVRQPFGRCGNRGGNSTLRGDSALEAGSATWCGIRQNRHLKSRQFVNSHLLGEGVMSAVLTMFNARPVIRKPQIVHTFKDVRHKTENWDLIQYNLFSRYKRNDYRKYVRGQRDGIASAEHQIWLRTSNRKFRSKHGRNCFVYWNITLAEWWRIWRLIT